MKKNQKNFFKKKFIKPYIFRILITNTSQKTYIQLKKTFQQIFLEKIREKMKKKSKKNFFKKSIKPYIFRILISTSQKTYIQLEKTFRQKFLEKFREKI